LVELWLYNAVFVVVIVEEIGGGDVEGWGVGLAW
jgi:hypothetical protein